MEREQSETGSTKQTPASSGGESTDVKRSSDRLASERASAEELVATAELYFVRWSNVDDERDIRFEIDVRDMVTNREATFRCELAEHLRTNEISKTHAREFAHLTAFQDTDSVAELMREEGLVRWIDRRVSEPCSRLAAHGTGCAGESFLTTRPQDSDPE